MNTCWRYDVSELVNLQRYVVSAVPGHTIVERFGVNAQPQVIKNVLYHETYGFMVEASLGDVGTLRHENVSWIELPLFVYAFYPEPALPAPARKGTFLLQTLPKVELSEIKFLTVDDDYEGPSFGSCMYQGTRFRYFLEELTHSVSRYIGYTLPDHQWEMIDTNDNLYRDYVSMSCDVDENGQILKGDAAKPRIKSDVEKYYKLVDTIVEADTRFDFCPVFQFEMSIKEGYRMMGVEYDDD